MVPPEWRGRPDIPILFVGWRSACPNPQNEKPPAFARGFYVTIAGKIRSQVSPRQAPGPPNNW